MRIWKNDRVERCCRFLLLLSWMFASNIAISEGAARPNIVLIIADDLGYGDLGCYGAADASTPHLDRLAERGMKFTDAYVTAPMCSPSRAGLLTGRYQQRFGYYGNWDTELVGLPRSEFTLAQLLKREGYRTSLVGKWHLGYSPNQHPTELGFEEFYGFLQGAHDYYDLSVPSIDPGKSSFQKRLRPFAGDSPFNEPLYRNTEPISDRGYLTERFSDEAVGFIERNHRHPFFLVLSYSSPHAPQQAPADQVARFQTGDPIRDAYLAMVAVLDTGVGKVSKTLSRLGLEKNTLIFFISDNGGWESRDSDPYWYSGASNAPFRGGKRRLYEGGIRVPVIASWPGKIPAASTSSQLVSSLDVLPTCLAATGSQLLPDRIFDGQNLLELPPDGTPLRDHLVWTMEPERTYAVRKGRWKLIHREGKTELFDLSQDSGEKQDLSTRNPDRVAQLQAIYEADRSWMRVPLSAPKRHWQQSPGLR